MAAAPKHMQPKLPRVMGQKQQGNTTPASHRVTAARGSDRHSWFAPEHADIPRDDMPPTIIGWGILALTVTVLTFRRCHLLAPVRICRVERGGYI